MTRRILIDTDPGQDDAVAMLLALASPEELEVAAITTVAGNVPLALTTANARRILDAMHRYVSTHTALFASPLPARQPSYFVTATMATVAASENA